mmetsp:Transcript_34924/g.69407  ORF Transcript_34924/g.69407 Transcript_34924/m.69407 type:complete len:231 (+) Transcript_34924:169-861(+)
MPGLITKNLVDDFFLVVFEYRASPPSLPSSPFSSSAALTPVSSAALDIQKCAAKDDGRISPSTAVDGRFLSATPLQRSTCRCCCCSPCCCSCSSFCCGSVAVGWLSPVGSGPHHKFPGSLSTLLTFARRAHSTKILSLTTMVSWFVKLITCAPCSSFTSPETTPASALGKASMLSADPNASTNASTRSRSSSSPPPASSWSPTPRRRRRAQTYGAEARRSVIVSESSTVA